MPEIVAEGLSFPEGPAFDPDGNLYVVNLTSGDISRITPDGRHEVVVNTGGKPNGSAWDRRTGTLTVCDCGLKVVLSVTPAGEVRMLTDHYNHIPYRGPNDCVYDPDGNLYFTDPVDSSEDNPIGKVYCRLTSGEVVIFDDGFAFPNGIAFGPDRSLYVAETNTRRIFRYTVSEPGSYEDLEEYVTLKGGEGPDGMAFDVEGNLYVAHFGKGCVAVVSPDGEVIEELDAGGQDPTNVAFGGPGNDELYVTESATGRVYRIAVGRKGLELY